MNRAEASALLNRAARQWHGKITVNREVQDAWTNALADMHADDGQAAYDHHVRTRPTNHVLGPADLWAAHRSLAGDPHARPRPEIAPPALPIAGPREAPHIAAAELAKMRAILGDTTPYRGRR